MLSESSFFSFFLHVARVVLMTLRGEFDGCSRLDGWSSKAMKFMKVFCQFLYLNSLEIIALCFIFIKAEVKRQNKYSSD